MKHSLLAVEVTYATIKSQKVIKLTVAAGTSVFNAIIQSKIQQFYPELEDYLHNPSSVSVGVFGKKINPHNYILQQHDRIEIYRALTKTPNQKRLERAKLLPPK